MVVEADRVFGFVVAQHLEDSARADGHEFFHAGLADAVSSLRAWQGKDPDGWGMYAVVRLPAALAELAAEQLRYLDALAAGVVAAGGPDDIAPWLRDRFEVPVVDDQDDESEVDPQ